ncbi:kelch repeat protein [Teladorsagia circumcincta]|uniref:Kelch repeat protein n=1 Tax=Teladorsagia circumcincta TaxID=45464 RepID=A0A2G9U7Q9_TELCI|nr:kelch repeat protein [Teladorsagia circumcincta]
MSVPRETLGAAALDGFVYAVGGYNGSECLDTVERYDPFRNEWIRVASLGTRRDDVSVSVLNGCLYAVGGWHWLLLRNSCTLWAGIIAALYKKPSKFLILRRISGDITAA